MIKGLSDEALQETVNYFISQLHLESYSQTKSGKLSGGNIRKLCVAQALIGGPKMLFLDEPSSGLDPISRRFLWNALVNNLTFNKSSMVLTTHSMPEAESLCGKIGILINGRFVCIGSI